MSSNQRTQNAVRALLKAGVQVSPDALTYLDLQSDPIQIASKTLEELDKRKTKPLVVTRSMLEGIIPEEALKHFRIIDFESVNLDVDKGNQAMASVEVLSSPYENSSSEGKIDDFIAYFNNRYEKLKMLFRARKDVHDAVAIKDAQKAKEGNKVKVIGLVSSKRETGKGTIVVELEDPTGSICTMMSGSDERTSSKGSRVLLDQVVCVEGTMKGDRTLSARDLSWADIPYDRQPNRASEPVYAVLISDIHYGSTKFLRDRFQEFIDWLRKEGPTEQAVNIAKNVRYLIIAGDLVDGLGVYPNQEEELEIKDIYRQYQELAAYIKKIPRSIEIITIPGNHDATRLALPQPPVPNKYIKPIAGSCPNFRMLGNPAFVKLHGVEVLIYHGKIIDNIVSTLPEISSKTVSQALHELIRCRHLAPTWDPNNPIIPASEDLLVLEKIPDILHTGHIHLNAVSQYRGVLTINSGTFQAQTSYQRSMGVKPTPAIVEIVNLMTLKPAHIHFSGDAE